MSSAAWVDKETLHDSARTARDILMAISTLGAKVILSHRILTGVLRALCLLALIASTGCGMLPQRAHRPESVALIPSAESPLVRIARDSAPAPDLTGFRLMPLGVYSLDARVELARKARYSLDVQYYLIANDRTGRLLLRNLRDAALRGVRVR